MKTRSTLSLLTKQQEVRMNDIPMNWPGRLWAAFFMHAVILHKNHFICCGYFRVAFWASMDRALMRFISSNGWVSVFISNHRCSV
jgi:hypothetical protein